MCVRVCVCERARARVCVTLRTSMYQCVRCACVCMVNLHRFCFGLCHRALPVVLNHPMVARSVVWFNARSSHEVLPAESSDDSVLTLFFCNFIRETPTRSFLHVASPLYFSTHSSHLKTSQSRPSSAGRVFHAYTLRMSG